MNNYTTSYFSLITLFIVIVIVIIIIIIYKNSLNNKNKITSHNKLLVVTYETDANNPHVNNLRKMLEKNNYNYTILGNETLWQGWYGRSVSYITYLNTLEDNIYILLCDGRDVIINQNNTIFLQKALELRKKNNNKIIVGAEEGCCTYNLDDIYRAKNIDKDINFIELYKSQQKQDSLKYNNDTFYYINFGMMFGTVYEFKRLFKLLNIQHNQDDQGLLHKLYYENPDLLYIDHNQELFSNIINDIYTKNTCYFSYDTNTRCFKNNRTNTYPSIIHTAGKFWDCYKYIVNKLIVDPIYV